jgi:5-methyltetrahydropteroyltriglutamate--homocysteine methyltransferase
MKRSSDRILTTHTGSLPRPADLVSMEEGHDQRGLQNTQRFEEQVKAAVREIVLKQVQGHVDVVNDGEASKVSCATYVTERLTGFEGESRPTRTQVDAAAFPEFYQERGMNPNALQRPVCSGPNTLRGDSLVKRDIDNLRSALDGVAT